MASFRLLPGYGKILPSARATLCHCQAQNDTSGGRILQNCHLWFGIWFAARAVLRVKRLLSILLFTLHQTAWNPDKHRASERWRVAGHSSPLFTTLHRINAEPLTYAREYCWAATYHEAWSSLMTSAGLQWWLKLGVGNDLGATKNTGWREVKSGEECIVTLHPCKPLIYSWLWRICEEWRVFLKVALYSSNAAKLLRKMWGTNNNYEVSNHFHTGITSIFKLSSSIVSSSSIVITKSLLPGYLFW